MRSNTFVSLSLTFNKRLNSKIKYLKAFGVNEFEAVVQIIGGKWKLRIIYILAFNQVLRYGELKRLLNNY